MSDNQETTAKPAKFDPTLYPPDSLFHERRTGKDRRTEAPPAAAVPVGRRVRPERRRRIDPTTFEKQYTDDEMEFMVAMQRFKVQTGKPFPSHGEVLRVAFSLGYRRVEVLDELDEDADARAVEVVPAAEFEAN